MCVFPVHFARSFRLVLRGVLVRYSYYNSSNLARSSLASLGVPRRVDGANRKKNVYLCLMLSVCTRSIYRSIDRAQAVLPVLETAVRRSRGMYAAGAYVHQYAQFGVEREHFDEAFLGVGQAVESYRSLG